MIAKQSNVPNHNLVYIDIKKRAPRSAPFHFLKISVNNFLINVNFVWIEFTLFKEIRIILLFAGGNPVISLANKKRKCFI